MPDLLRIGLAISVVVMAVGALVVAYDALFNEEEYRSQHDFIYRDWADKKRRGR
jgi:hypothetical protein